MVFHPFTYQMTFLVCFLVVAAVRKLIIEDDLETWLQEVKTKEHKRTRRTGKRRGRRGRRRGRRGKRRGRRGNGAREEEERRRKSRKRRGSCQHQGEMSETENERLYQYKEEVTVATSGV